MWFNKCMTKAEILKVYPIHYHVWFNDEDALCRHLENDPSEIEKKDARGRTPLMLAVTLRRFRCTEILCNYNADVNTEAGGWSLIQEATSTADKKLLHFLMEERNIQRHSQRMRALARLFQQLRDAPDFFVEMKWEFTSWVPVVSRYCPNDTCKIYKQGSNVRVDCTLMGFDDYKWIRGNTSIIFNGNEDGGVILEVDHNAQKVIYYQKQFMPRQHSNKIVNQLMVTRRLRNPIVTSYVDTDKITFERAKSGVWGWRQDKFEVINGHDCKVFSTSNVEIITKSRSEHLSEHDRKRLADAERRQKRLDEAEQRQVQDSDDDFVDFNDDDDDAEVDDDEGKELIGKEKDEANKGKDKQDGMTEESEGQPDAIVIENSEEMLNGITAEEYFTKDYSLGDRDIGPKKKINVKVQKFRTNLWLCEDYPLSFQEQIIPIVNLMATNSSHFRKLKDFIEMQLPSGFPVKIEIPLYHLFNAVISFSNIFAMENAVEGVTVINDASGSSKPMCFIDSSVFEPPVHYVTVDRKHRKGPNRVNIDEEDKMLQLALEKSMFDSRNNSAADEQQVDVWNAIYGMNRNDAMTDEEAELQFAIEQSLRELSVMQDSENVVPIEQNFPKGEDDFELALALSKQEEQEREEQRKMEDEMLRRVLEISLAKE